MKHVVKIIFRKVNCFLITPQKAFFQFLSPFGESTRSGIEVRVGGLLLLIFCSINGLQAQDSIINRNITVEREYKPIIQDAGKINSSPEILEQTVPKTIPTYSDYNLPLNVDFNIHTLPAADLQMDKPQFKNGFARIGFGNNFNTLADFAFPLVKTAKTRLDFSLNHLGTFDAKAHSVTNANLLFDLNFDSFGFFAGMGGGHEYLKYYGNNFNRYGTIVSLDSLATNFPANYVEQNLVRVTRNPQIFNVYSLANDSTSETFWRFNAFVGFRSLPTSDELRYQAKVQYNVFSSLNGLSENAVRTNLGFNTASRENRLGIDAEMQNLFYHSDHPSLLNFWDTYTVVSVNPYYSIERDDWNLRLGVKSAFSFVHGLPFNPSADISAEWKAIPKYFSIYGGITGGYHVNTMNEMFTENRYLFPDVRVQDTYSPFEFYAGIKLKPLYNLLIDGFVDFKHINNQYFFVNKEYAVSSASSFIPPAADSTLYTNRFNVIYSAANLLKIGIRANYNFQDKLNIELKGALNKWTVATEQYAWNKPAVEAELNADYHITNNFSFNFTSFFEGERYAKLGNAAVKMNPKIDINLGASYTYNTWLSVFAKVNNLINNSYQDFYGYDVQGFNVLVGAAFSF
jgi:hypothetical protein